MDYKLGMGYELGRSEKTVKKIKSDVVKGFKS